MPPVDLVKYDRDVFDRRFMNCWRRQAMVGLKDRDVPVELLFFRSLVSTDQIFEQMVKEGRRRYEFTSRFLDNSDLKQLGVSQVMLEPERPTDIVTIAESAWSVDNVVLLAGDVFYLPHCPEFRQKHTEHMVTLVGRRDGDWSIVDDDADGILCGYSYPDRVVFDFFENCTMKRMRQFSVGKSPANARGDFANTFLSVVSDYTDSLWFMNQFEAYLQYPFSSRIEKSERLRDFFSIYSGSRNSFAQFCKIFPELGPLVNVMEDISRQAHATQKRIAGKGGDFEGDDATVSFASGLFDEIARVERYVKTFLTELASLDSRPDQQGVQQQVI
ncbi:hypothetical protein OKW43_001359 [Paraburkholderia sp. WC7.3g]|uniref:hypothetical protein n=1 Tax=Paraburkholderia sp. WC7.3g TaxID=2991070 RepID=UPI003D2040FE